MLKKKQKQKEEEYKKINWNNLEDPLIQKANIIYSDRINTYRRMKGIDELLDNTPTVNLISEMVELGIRNRLCFEELMKFNDSGKFKNKHPLLLLDKQRLELVKLLENNLNEFLEEYRSSANNIVRYKSYLSKNKDEAKLEQYRNIIKKHEDNILNITQLLKEYVAGIQNTTSSD